MLDFQFSIYKKFRIYTRHGYIASKIDGEAYFSDRLYSLTVSFALLPEKGSVPAPALIRYWLLARPCLEVR